jgi:hypothetical protein
MKKPMWNSEAVKAYETGQGVELVTTPHPHYRPLPKELESQEPVAYDKTEINFFVQDLYDKKMQEGKHGHYETMFHVVHQAIKRATPPQLEQNFCPRCGKRTNDIHTCTPPQENT